MIQWDDLQKRLEKIKKDLEIVVLNAHGIGPNQLLLATMTAQAHIEEALTIIAFLRSGD